MQAFFAIFFLMPQPPCLERRSIGNADLLRTRPPLQLLATRGPGSAKIKHDLAAATDPSI